MQFPEMPLSPARLNRIFEGQALDEPAAVYPRIEGQLISHMLRYARGQYDGIAVLVSGDRGQGKTACVHRCLESSIRKVLKEGKLIVPVMLTSPELFSDGLDMAEDGHSKGENPQSKDEKLMVQKHEWLSKLTQALAMYVIRYHGHYAQLKNSGLTGVGAESKVEYEYQLCNFAFLPSLREAYEDAHGLARCSEKDFRTILALDALISMARSISGKTHSRQNIDTRRHASKRDEVSFGQAFSNNWNLLYKGLLSFVSGVAAFALSESSMKLMAILIGVVAALAVYIIQTWIQSLEKEQSVYQEQHFEPDLTISSLSRRLPGVVSKLRQAGICPIFVLDDSNQELSKEQGDLLKFGKWFKSFFSDDSMLIVVSSSDYFKTIHQPLRADLRNFYTSQYYLIPDPVSIVTVLGEMESDSV